MKKVLLILGLMVLLLLSATGSAGAVSSDCSKCHGTVVSSFTVAPPVVTTACKTCHNSMFLSATHANPTYSSVKVTGVGWFKTTSGPSTGVPAIHAAHNGLNSPAGNSGCSNCHKAANCETCHNPTNHRIHGSTANPVNPSYVVGWGTGYGSKQISCSTSTCHKFYNNPGITVARTDGKQLCINCHSVDKTGHTMAGLDAVHTSTTGSLTINAVSQPVSCGGCHDGTLSAEHKAVAVRLGQAEDAECGYCHLSTATTSVKTAVSGIKLANKSLTDPAVKAANRACTECHFDLNVILGPTEHATYHKADASGSLNVVGGPHATCDTCHSTTKNLVMNVTVDSTVYEKTLAEVARMPVKNYSCLDCHNTQNNLAPKHKAGFGGAGDQTDFVDLHPGCTTCHTPGTPAADKVTTILASLNSGDTTYSCGECHAGVGHEGPLDANCQTCHEATLDKDHINNPKIPATSDNTCGTCHSSTDATVKATIKAGITDCGNCHTAAHNFNLAPTVPADIPKYAGFEWSSPQDASIWADEPWFDATYATNSKRLFSNRKTGISADDVKNFYITNMTGNGWTKAVEETVNTTTIVKFTKGLGAVTVMYYNTETPTGTVTVSTGYRIDIFYK